MKKPTIIIDFDGVIHSYKSGWQGIDVIPDKPVSGIKECISELRKNYIVVVFSTRCSEEKGVIAIKKWLNEYGIIVDNVVSKKYPAILTIDDRCICFDGNANTLIDKIKNFKAWNKEEFEILKRRRKNIEQLIQEVVYIKLGNKTTICHIVTHFGFEFIGKAFCANPDGFKKEIGEKTAYEDGLKQIEENLLFTEAFNKYASGFERREKQC